MDHAGSNSSSGEQAAEQYVPPLSAHDMVARATSLLTKPRRGSSLRDKVRELGRPKFWLGTLHFDKWKMLKLEAEVRAAYPCPHPRLADACATALALALLPLCAERRLTVYCDDACEEAVAAFFAALEHPTCAVEGLNIKGAAFGTRKAAAHLSRCLDVKSALRELTIQDVGGLCGEALWIAFSHKLPLAEGTLVPEGTVGTWVGPSAQLATLEGVEGWGAFLKHNSTITCLDLDLVLPQRGGLLVPIFDALLINSTLQMLTIRTNVAVYSDFNVEEAANTVDDANILKLVAMLRTNRTLTRLDIISSGIVCNALMVNQGLSQNNTLEEVALSMDAVGAQALMTALGSVSATTSNLGPHLKSLRLGHYLGGKSFPSATALGNMLTCNESLMELDLTYAPYSNQEWAETIIPAFANNSCLQRVHLLGCEGVDGELVYNALLRLFDSGTCITYVGLHYTPLYKDGKAQVVQARVEANKVYRAALKDLSLTTTTSCRLMLCGYPRAGKSTLLQTMLCAYPKDRQRLHEGQSCDKSGKNKESREVTRGIDIQPLIIDGLTIWVWDFAGQKEFHPLQDFIFPNATAVHAATIFVFAFNPISGDGTMGGKTPLERKCQYQFKQEFSYWLKFICSNSKQSGMCKPFVLVVVTHKDRFNSTSTSQVDHEDCFGEWVRDVAKTFSDKVSLDARNVFFMDATDCDDPTLGKFVQCAISLLRERINHDVTKVSAICDSIAKALGGGSRDQPLEPIMSMADFQNCCEFVIETSIGRNHAQQEALTKLLSEIKDKGAGVIAAYLHDRGEVLFFRDLDFLVRNPRWFAHGILGHLIDFFPEDSTSAQDLDDKHSQPTCDSDMFENGLVNKNFLADVLQKAIKKVGLNSQGTHVDQLILLMEKFDLCYKTPQKYLIPTLFKDKGGKADRGECQRRWELHASVNPSTCCFVARRLQCSDSFRTSITPGFFPRLQVMLTSLVDQWGNEAGNCTCILEKGFCRLILNDMEILVEYSGYFDYFVDIMVKSYLSAQDTADFLEAKIISEIRRLCASSKGCQGVSLVQAIIRPDCVTVGEDITLCRYRQAVQVASLEEQIVRAPDLKYSWPAVKDERGNTVLPATFYRPHDLLDPKWVGWKQEVCYPDSNVDQGRRRGVAVIVSMVKYKRGNRSGGREDQAKLMALIEDLRFEVKLLEDFKAGKLQEQMKEIAATSISAEDESFLCFVMGHGNSTKDGTHFMVDQDEVRIMLDDIVWPFRTCEQLQGKPKACFVISCRGSNQPLAHPKPESGVQHSTDWKEGTEVRYVQELTDWLMVFSTSAGSVSARYPGYGTTFVGALVTNFYHPSRQATDVLGILNYVNEEVTTEEHKAEDGTDFGQCPVVVHTLTKRLYWKRRAV